MNVCTASLVSALLTTSLLAGSASAQCSAPELVKGADKYNDLVCKGYAAVGSGDLKKALELFLAASTQPVLESPNTRLFGRIAKTYAALGRFQEAEVYLRYDNMSVLWMIGIVRCKPMPNAAGDRLFQDGKALTSEEAKHMVDVLCGPMFDEFSYFRDRDTKSFVPAAEAILRHVAASTEIDRMRHRQHPAGR